MGYIAVLALVGCGESVSVDDDNADESGVSEPVGNEPTEGTDLPPLVSLNVEQEFYDAQCLDCHGGRGDGAFLLDTSSCAVADCSSIDTLASYINV